MKSGAPAVVYAEHTTRTGKVYYTVRLEERGGVGVTQWGDRPSWPIIEDVSTSFVTLANGICVEMPAAEWAPAAVARWHAVRRELQEM